MVLETTSSENVKINIFNRKGRKTALEIYKAGIDPHIPWIKEQINKSKDKEIIIKIKDIVDIEGKNLHKNTIYTIHKNLKTVLFLEGIVVDMGISKDGDDLLFLRTGKNGEKLPYILSKKLDSYLKNLNQEDEE